jgi:hypothetical protein
MSPSPLDMKVAELERLVKALTLAIKVDASGSRVEIKTAGGATIVLSAGVSINGATVNINNGALEVI